MNKEQARRLAAGTMLDFFPPRIRSSLLSDAGFVKKWDIPTVTTISLGKDGPAFDRAAFFDGIRAAIRDPNHTTFVIDSNELSWKLVIKKEGFALRISIEASETKLFIPDHTSLSDEPAVRVSWFEEIADQTNLDPYTYKKWHTRLSETPLSDDEFAELDDEISLTPPRILQTITNGLARGTVTVDMIVPNRRRYYERLVGNFNAAKNVVDFIEVSATPLVENLIKWRNVEGFLFALAQCSINLISDTIRTEALSNSELLGIFESLADHGDPISKLGAIEVGMENLRAHPNLEPIVERMVNGLIHDDPKNADSQFSLLSALVELTIGEMSRKQVLRDVPPYYRRHAAIAQASLIIRAINGANIEIAGITEWAHRTGLRQLFHLQTLIDLRQEPRWLPDYISAQQLRAEFTGRLVIAANKFKKDIKSKSLRKLLLEDSTEREHIAPWPLSLLPGPMEGATTPNIVLPDDLNKNVQEALSVEHLDVESFTTFINTAIIYQVPPDQSSLAAAALRRVKYSIEKVGTKENIFGLIGALAIVAAATRSFDLADELRILTRVMRRRGRLSVLPHDEIRIAMTAAASHTDIAEWASFAGDWIKEIAFEADNAEAVKQFAPMVRRLVALEPALARHLAEADAALASFSI